MITLRGLTKRYGDHLAVDDLSVDIHPGQVTGFLGPNGAGKSTTMRMILGLDRPTSGQALINGRRYGELRQPAREIGSLLEARGVHPGRSAYHHLLAQAHYSGIPRSRVDDVCELVGLSQVAKRRVGGFSLGMGQRLGIASALLGDPGIVMLDEPVNGLDPDGIRWIRELLRSLAAEGRTVFVSSHLMSEMEDTAHHLIVIGKGQLIADAPIEDVIARSSHTVVRVRTPDAEHLRERLLQDQIQVEQQAPTTLRVWGLSTDEIGDVAHTLGIRLHELSLQSASLEQAYLELSNDSREYITSSLTDAKAGV